MADTSLAHLARSGIYEIVNTINGKRYVGSAVNIALRWRQHRCELGKGRHNPHMQRAWLKYGEAAFEFRVIEYVEEKSRLIEREQHYLDEMRPQYNCARVAGSNLGVRYGPDFSKKISEANRRLWASPEHRQKMSKAHIGYVATAEHRANLSAANLGRKLSDEHLSMLRKANSERNKSAKHRSLMSVYWKGRPKSPEQIDKMAATKRGGVLTEDHKRKVGEALRRAYLEGRRVQVFTEETRSKIGRSVGKLNDDQVRVIRARASNGERQALLAKEFCISGPSVSNICNRKTYQWVLD